jgi:hypothetical protein
MLVWHEANSLPVVSRRDWDNRYRLRYYRYYLNGLKLKQKINSSKPIVPSKFSQMIVRTTDMPTLFKACEQSTKLSQWIIDAGSQTVLPAMIAGADKQYHSVIKAISTDGQVRRLWTMGTAIRSRVAVVCNDIENDPAMYPWRTEAAKVTINNVCSN